MHSQGWFPGIPMKIYTSKSIGVEAAKGYHHIARVCLHSATVTLVHIISNNNSQFMNYTVEHLL